MSDANRLGKADPLVEQNRAKEDTSDQVPHETREKKACCST